MIYVISNNSTLHSPLYVNTQMLKEAFLAFHKNHFTHLIKKTMHSSISLQRKQTYKTKMTILERYDKFCASQKGKEFLWFSISFITLLGSIMPIALIVMYFTPWFYQFIFISMMLFFGNWLTVIGRASIKVIISFYLLTVGINITIPILSFLLFKILI